MFPNNHNHQSPPHSAVQPHQITTTSDQATATTNKESKPTNDSVPLEAARRPRGRPPGTKNKPKSSSSSSSVSSVTRQPDPCMSPYVLEVSSGSDIIAAVTRFCNNRNTSLSVLSGSGSVANVSFRLNAAPTARMFRGCFSLLSVSATVIPSSSPISTMLTPNSDFLAKFVISVVSPQGQMLGGVVVGPLIASGTVYIVAAALNNPIYQRLPMEEDNHIGYGYVPVPIDQSLGSGSGDSGQHHAAQLTPTAVQPLSMYRLPVDLGWPTTPRQDPPHSSHY